MKHNIFMFGRLLTIKKSTWLMASLVVNALLFIGSSLWLVFVVAEYDSIFFLFCLFTGIHQIIRSCLFKFDSSCYLGVALLLVGFFYFLSKVLGVYWLYSVFIVLAFAFASFVVGVFYHQPFQIFLSILLYFVSIGLLLFLLKIISLWIFVAILIITVLLFIVRFISL